MTSACIVDYLQYKLRIYLFEKKKNDNNNNDREKVIGKTFLLVHNRGFDD